MIADVMNNNIFQTIIKKLFIRCRKINVSQSYFSVPKHVGLNSTYYVIFKVNNKRESQNIAFNHSADIDYKDFSKTYRNCTKGPYSFFTINTILPVNDPMRFRKNFSDSPL